MSPYYIGLNVVFPYKRKRPREGWLKKLLCSKSNLPKTPEPDSPVCRIRSCKDKAKHFYVGIYDSTGGDFLVAYCSFHQGCQIPYSQNWKEIEENEYIVRQIMEENYGT